MTVSKTSRRPWPAAIVLAGLALVGCSGGNVGSSWQCPLAQGGTCDSVAGADPAVPQTASADGMTIREPLYRARGGARAGPAAQPCEADCDGGFDPFAWLVRLFEAEDGGDDSPPAHAGPMEIAPGAGPDPAFESAIDTPALPGALEPVAGLRTQEVVARIWIAPFVDANGVYREASHVRVVLEPAGWRVP